MNITNETKLRFFSKVNISGPNDCWEWQGCKDDCGYGCFYLHTTVKTHRLSWKMFNGQIPTGLCVCHSCDNPSCVNPNHLWLGTRIDNLRDASNKNRLYKQSITHCLRGHEFTKENTLKYKYTITNKRRCKICMHIRYKKYRLEKQNETK